MIYSFNSSSHQVVLEQVSYIRWSYGKLHIVVNSVAVEVNISHGAFVLFEREWRKAQNDL